MYSVMKLLMSLCIKCFYISVPGKAGSVPGTFTFTQQPRLRPMAGRAQAGSSVNGLPHSGHRRCLGPLTPSP